MYNYDDSSMYSRTDFIKVVVKQITARVCYQLDRKAAGALTESASKAFKLLCDEVVGPESSLVNRTDKIIGSMYSRTDKANGRKYQVLKSAGKHLNACLSILQFTKDYLYEFITQRRKTMTKDEMQIFFSTLLQRATSDNNRIDMLEISSVAKKKLVSFQSVKPSIKKHLADLILIGLNKNQQNVKAARSTTVDTDNTNKT